MCSPGLVLETEYSTDENPPSPFPPSLNHRRTQMFLKGRERQENPSSPSRVDVLLQNDLRREVWLYPEKRAYSMRPIWELATPEEMLQAQRSGARYMRQFEHRNKERTRFDVYVETKKTDDVAEFFDYPAERYITETRCVYPGDAGRSRVSISDAWYIDLRHPAMPEPSRVVRMCMAATGNEQPVFHCSGVRPSGIPAKVVTTTRQVHRIPDKTWEHTSTHASEIVRLEECMIDEGLFEVPKGFRELPLYPSRWSDYRRQFRNLICRMRIA